MAKAKKASKRKIEKKVESSSSSETVTLTKTNLWQIATGILAVALVVVLVGNMGGNGDTQVPNIQQPQVPGQQPVPTGNVQVSLEGANTLGDPNAPVVFVEYSSFTCPFCGNFAAETFPRIVQEFVETGKVLYVYKHFLRNELDVVAANAAECAGEQGSFFEYKKEIYANQQSIQTPGFFEGIASRLNLNTAEWQACFDSQRYSDKALAERNEGISNGIQGTPGFIIDGTPFTRGAQPFSVFAAEINRALN